MKGSVFLTAHWKKLLMANYEVDPSILLPWLPAGTVLDLYNGKCLVSLVGFLFAETRIKGVAIPFHQTFPEVNLRFYVKQQVGTEWKRGVVFISEIVPKPAIAWIANTLFNEHYSYRKMSCKYEIISDEQRVEYTWKHGKNWNSISAGANINPLEMRAGGGEEFIFEHYLGFSKISNIKTGFYKVEHPAWKIYPVTSFKIECNFQQSYGDAFAHFTNKVPHSVYLAEGSPVKIYGKKLVE